MTWTLLLTIIFFYPSSSSFNTDIDIFGPHRLALFSLFFRHVLTPLVDFSCHRRLLSASPSFTMKASRGLAAVLLLAPVSALSIGSADLRKGVSPPVAPGIPVAFGASSTTTLDSFVSSIVNSAAASPTSQASAPDISSLISRLSSQLVSDISASSEKTKSTIATTTSLQSTSTSSSSSAMATSSPTGGSGTANSVNSQGSQDTGGGKDNKKLTIILAVVLSILGLVLICIAAVLVMRYRRGQSPFSRLAKRGATPIDDDGKTYPFSGYAGVDSN